MAQISKEQKLKELTDWMEAFNLSPKSASSLLNVPEDVFAAVQNGKSMPRAMWNELKTRFDYKQSQCEQTSNTNNSSAAIKNRKQAPEKVIDVEKEHTVVLQKTQMTLAFTADIVTLKRACKRWLDNHPRCKSKDLLSVVEAMLQDMFQ